MRRWLAVVAVVFAKEAADILRDRRALLTVGVVAILAGPVLLLMLANMLAGFEARAERRIALVDGIDHAPTLRNYLLRETVRIEPAPPGYADALRAGRLPDPVLVVPADFEARLAAGEVPRLVILTDSGNARADAGVARLQRWLSGFAAQRSALELAMRGVAAGNHGRIEIDVQDSASPLARATRVFGMLPFFFVLAALYGVWGAALDTTVGERERGTLQPLLLTPAAGGALVAGKWLAVSAVGAGITALTVLSFLPAQVLMPGETLRAMFVFGTREVLTSLALFLPLPGLFAALLMLVGAGARTLRAAQAGATGVMLAAALLPLAVKTGDGAVGWPDWVPVLSQHAHMLALLAGDAVSPWRILLSAAACLAIACAALVVVSRQLPRRIA